MPSSALLNWQRDRANRLATIENAHRAVGGGGPGRRYATEQINQAYAVLLASEFQGFCRDLHSESADALVRGITPVALRPVVLADFLFSRKLDKGNANYNSLSEDFSRLGLFFWNSVDAHDSRNPQRREGLEMLNRWRNAIAHQDFDPRRLGGTTVLHLAQVRRWRQQCNGLAQSFDMVFYNHLLGTTGMTPW